MPRKPSKKSPLEEPRGRRVLSGATHDDPLIPCQILRVRRSVWAALDEMAAEKIWHRTVLIREILDRAVLEWKKAKKKAGEDEQAA